MSDAHASESLTETEKILLAALIRSQTNMLREYLDEHPGEQWVQGRVTDYETLVRKLNLPPSVEIVRKFSRSWTV